MKVIKAITFFSLIIFAGSIITSAQESVSLKVGDKAPVFTTLDDNNQKWDVNKYIGKKNIVLFFYPAAMTGGCTNQACAYRDNIVELEKENAIVVGISGDEVENLKIFKQAHDLNFPLLSDYDGEIAKKFGVPIGGANSITREINGREVVLQRGVTSRRWTFVINTSGEISYINREVNASNDSKDVLNALRADK